MLIEVRNLTPNLVSITSFLNLTLIHTCPAFLLQLLHHILGGLLRPRPAGARRELRLQEVGDGVGLGVPGVQRAGAGRLRVRRPWRGAGDPGHDTVDAGRAVKGDDVEGHCRGLLRHRALLLPRSHDRVLGLRTGRRRQRAHGAQPPAVAHRRRQSHGRRACRGKLSGSC